MERYPTKKMPKDTEAAGRKPSLREQCGGAAASLVAFGLMAAAIVAAVREPSAQSGARASSEQLVAGMQLRVRATRQLSVDDFDDFDDFEDFGRRGREGHGQQCQDRWSGVHFPADTIGRLLAASLCATGASRAKVEHETCEPNPLSCLIHPGFAARCPSSCVFWTSLATTLRANNGVRIAVLLLTAVHSLGACDFGNQGMLSEHPEGALESLEVHACPACPSASCCVGFPLTTAEALASLVSRPKLEPARTMFSQLADYSLHVLHESRAEEYYNNTVKFYGQGSTRVDVGWANVIISNLHLYTHAPRTHSYRAVPTLADGSLNFNFSVGQLGDSLKIGLIADWGCGNIGARRVLEELKKQDPDFIIHLGDTYYSGTIEEQKQNFIGLAREVLGPGVPLLGIPGNHDYYSGGEGFLHVIDELAQSQTPSQQASFFALRGARWQIVALDTGIRDGFALNYVASALAVGPKKEAIRNASRQTMPFLPDDQLEWTLRQIEIGAANGLKTIMLSHHQLFSRRFDVGFPSGRMRDHAFDLDAKAGVYYTGQSNKTAHDLPGNLGPDQLPAVNTRLLDQFPESVLAHVDAWFWGHEHAMSLFAPYAGLRKGRLIGNACIPMSREPTFDIFAPNNETVGQPWGGIPEVLNGSKVGQGDLFWNLGFATVDLAQDSGVAKYFELEDYTVDGQTQYKDAVNFFSEQL